VTNKSRCESTRGGNRKKDRHRDSKLPEENTRGGGLM